jgi:hypothetical protein
MSALEHFARVADRVRDLGPLREPIRQVLINGKREQLLRGVDRDLRPFVPLAASTLAHRRGGGPPLAPLGGSAPIVLDYQVTIDTQPGRLEISATWPGWTIIKYHRTGTRRMPRRDPTGFRNEDLERVRQLLKDFLLG